MSRLSIEQLVTTPATLNYLSESAYDYTKWNLGKGLIYNNGASAIDKYIAPHFDVIRPMEESTAFAALFSVLYNLSTTTAYISELKTLLVPQQHGASISGKSIERPELARGRGSSR